MADGVFELAGRTMCAASKVLLCERGEPSFNLIEPRRRGRREMNVEARMASEPCLDRRRLMGTVIFHHQMPVQRRRNVGFDRAQELQKFAAAMAPVQLPDHFTGGDV